MASHVRPVFLALAGLLVLVLPALANPDTYVVKRSSNLRAGPASTTTRIRGLDAGEMLEADVDSVAGGYRYISTDAGERGWVWTKNIKLSAEEGGGVTPPATTGANSISPAWAKPAPNRTTFKCADGSTCGPHGSVGDSITNLRCNCHKQAITDVDVHMALVEKRGQGEEQAIVVETSPRVRKNHAGWNTAALSPLVDSDTRVRITGWLMYDPEHRAMIGTHRSTMWEIHPITKIEVSQGGGSPWLALN